MGIKGLPEQLKHYYRDAHVEQFKGMNTIDAFLKTFVSVVSLFALNIQKLTQRRTPLSSFIIIIINLFLTNNNETREYNKGMRAAVDAYSWLHKGAYSCALECATGNHYWLKQNRDAPYVNYCMHRAKMLKFFGVEPVIVFDGDRLPAKASEEGTRRQRREEAKQKGRERLEQGNREGATFMFTQSLDISPRMALELIVALKREGIEFVVAPYEADAQIAHLAKQSRENGGVDVVFTEDSDLVAYGCERVCFKLDKFGACKEVLLEDVLRNKTAAAMTTTTTPSDEMTTTNNDESEMTINNESQMTVENDGTNESDENVDAKKKTATAAAAAKKKGGSKSSAGGKGSRGANSPLSFENWTHDDFLGLCAMSGCDFLENVRNVGFKKAHAFVNKNDRCAKTALEMMSKDPKIDVPEDYVEKWQRAVYTFRHALIYDVKEKTLKHLTPLPEELLGKTSDELDFLGKVFEDKVAIEIAEGRMDPIARRPSAHAQPHFQQRYNNNYNNMQNVQPTNEGPKIPKVNINSMFAAKKVAASTAPAPVVAVMPPATAAITTTTTVPPPSQPRRSPRKHPQSMVGVSSEKKEQQPVLSAEDLEDLEIAKMLGAAEQGVQANKHTPAPPSASKKNRTPLSSPNKQSHQKPSATDNSFKRTFENNKNDENVDIRNKFSKTASNNTPVAELKKLPPKPPSVNKKFGAPEKEKTIFKLSADGGLKEIKTKPKSIASFFAPVKKK